MYFLAARRDDVVQTVSRDPRLRNTGVIVPLTRPLVALVEQLNFSKSWDRLDSTRSSRISRIEVPRKSTGVGIRLQRRHCYRIFGIPLQWSHWAPPRCRRVSKRLKVTTSMEVRYFQRLLLLTFRGFIVQMRKQVEVRIVSSAMSTVNKNRAKV